MKCVSAVIMLFCLFLMFHRVGGQEDSGDTLFLKSYDELSDLFYRWLPKDTLIAKKIANAYIAKGREKGDSLRMAKGYYYYAEFGPEMGIQYADTIIKLTKSSEDKFHPTVGYMIKGYWNYHTDNYTESIKYYLISYKYALKKKNIKHLVYIRPMIAALKNRSGDHEGALNMQKENLYTIENDPKFKEEYSKDPNHGNLYKASYLSAIYNLAISYLHLRKIDSAKIYFRRSIEESLKYKDTLRYYQSVSAAGSAEYYAGNYQAALDSLDKALPHLTDRHSIAMNHYYKGQSYRELKEHNKAMSMFLISDSVAGEIDYKFPELRQAYEYLVEHYRKEQQADSQLIYINKILDLDEALLKVRAMDGQISREYDTPHLMRKKEALIRDLERKDSLNKRYKLFLLGAVVILLGFIVYYYQRQGIYRKRYRELLNKSEEKEKAFPGASKKTKSDSDVPEEIFSEIEKRLRKFEERKQFVNSEVTLHRLAKEFRTNSSYLSRVINTVQGINFSQYLHRLRINNIVDRLKEEEKLRAYSMEALAGEAGYKTVQSFTNAFYKQTGIYPSYFIKMLKNK